MNEILDTDRLRETVLELQARWKTAQASLGVSTIQLVDLVALADPDFEGEVATAADNIKLRDRLERLDRRFRQFSKTALLHSPYETLLCLHDHGCKLVTEQRTIDIYSPDGEMLGGVAGVIPWQQPTDG